MQVYEMLDLISRHNDEIKWIRLVVYIRDNVIFDRKYELENTEDMMCWIDVKMQGR